MTSQEYGGASSHATRRAGYHGGPADTGEQHVSLPLGMGGEKEEVMANMQSGSMQTNHPRRSAQENLHPTVDGTETPAGSRTQEGSTMQIRQFVQHAVASVLVLMSLSSSPVMAQSVH